MSQAEIVVGVDGSRAAETALLWAAAEAQRRNARLVIAYAGDTELIESPRRYEAARSGGPLLAAARSLVLASGVDCAIQTICRDQPAVAMLSGLGEHAALLVIGSHGMGSHNCSSLGSVAYGVAAHALCPVAVIDASCSDESALPVAEDHRPVTVGVTASPTGAAALEFAFAEAALRQVSLKAVHSWAELDWSEASSMAALSQAGQDLRAIHENRLLTMLAPLRQKYPGVVVQLCVSGHPVAWTLTEASEGSSMLVLGCRHPGGRPKSRLGPTAARLVNVSRCPVVVTGNPQVRAPATPTARSDADHLLVQHH